MTGYVMTTGAALLMLLAALPTGARAGDVTWRECEKDGRYRGRILGSGPDNDASYLNLHYCDITNLQSNAFNGLPNLKAIFLYGNNIKNVSPAIFNSVRNITHLDLSLNKLQEVPNFGEHSLFPHLTYLPLHNNQITAISNPNTFSACGQLQDLQLHFNQIQYLHPDVFKPLTHLSALNLYGNKIKIITDTMFTIKSLQSLSLGHNLIEYVPPRAFHGSGLEYLNLNNNKITWLPQNFVSELNRAGARLEGFTFGDNPWHCACLLEQLTDAKRAGVAWVSGNSYGLYYDGKTPQCVFTGRHSCPRLSRPSRPTLLPPPYAAAPAPAACAGHTGNTLYNKVSRIKATQIMNSVLLH